MTLWDVELNLVTLGVTVEADDEDAARAEGIESLRQAIESDLDEDNLVVTRQKVAGE